MTTSDQYADILQKLCDSQPLAVLATVAGSEPYTSLVAVAFSHDLRNLYFATPRATRKWHNLLTNAKVSFLIDNRSNQVADFRQAAAATVIGTARELTGGDRQDGHHLYLVKHSHLDDFLAGSDCALFQVTVDKIYLVTRFQTVKKFDFST